MRGTQETQVWSLGQEDPLEEKMAAPSSVLAWRIPWTEEPGGPQSRGSHRVGHDWVCTHAHTNTYSHQQCTRDPFPPHLYQHLLLLVFFIIIVLIGVRWYLIVAVIYISMVVNNAGHPFLTHWPSVCLLWKNVYSDLQLIFKLDCLGFLLLNCMSSL